VMRRPRRWCWGGVGVTECRWEGAYRLCDLDSLSVCCAMLCACVQWSEGEKGRRSGRLAFRQPKKKALFVAFARSALPSTMLRPALLARPAR